MDEMWQDIKYVKHSFGFSVTGKNDVDMFVVRQVHIVTIAFGTFEMKITYRDVDGEYHDITLKKLPLHTLIID